MLLTLVYFVLALLLLVIVHEYGHFFVARCCGVKVLRFSFGFGKVLARIYDKKGTEYAWSLLPLGGYVKMLDETEEAVDDKDRPYAFNNQSLLKRTLIVIAGPMFNFIFAFFALWLVLIIGVHSLAPIVETVKPNSLAAQAGLASQEEILAVNDIPINSWSDFQYALIALMGSGEPAQITVKSLVNHKSSKLSLPIQDWNMDDKNTDPLMSLGIVPFFPKIPPLVGEVVPDSPAYKADLRISDRIVGVDGKPVDDWLFLVDYVKKHPNTAMQLTIIRQDHTKKVDLISGSQESEGATVGYLGLRSQKLDWPDHWLRLERENPLQAFGSALKKTVDLTGTTFVLMGRLITGKLSLQTISGPVGIAQNAGESARSGLTSYLLFLALVSISLGALNLLPIPMLDGGHLLYYALEVIRRKPLSEGAKSIGVYLGMLLLVALMFIALNNDLSRLTS